MKKMKIKRFFVNTGVVLALILMTAVFDYFFIWKAKEIEGVFDWFILIYHNVLILGLTVSVIHLRNMEKCRLIKIPPSLYLLILGAVETVVCSIMRLLKGPDVKIVFSVSGIVWSIVVLSIVILMLENRARMKKEADIPENTHEDEEVEEEVDEEELAEEAEPEIEEPVKVQSPTMLQLTVYVTKTKEWENLNEMPFLDELKDMVVRCKQYTYEELLGEEEELKDQLNALKKYTLNNSGVAAEKVSLKIMTLLKERECVINEYEDKNIRNERE